MPDEKAAAQAGGDIINHLERMTAEWSWIDGSGDALPKLTTDVEQAADDRGYYPITPDRPPREVVKNKQHAPGLDS
jgi:hypothetical protein